MKDLLEKARIEPGEHEGRPVIWLRFPYDRNLISEAKAIQAKWSNTQRCWYVTDNQHYRGLLQLPPAMPIGKEAMAAIHEVNLPALQQMHDTLVLRGYSPNTIRTYCKEFAQLLHALDKVPVTSLDEERIRNYILHCIRNLELKENQVHSRLNALRFYFEKVLGRPEIIMQVPRPKKPYILPKVLSTPEIRRLFAATDNIKHRMILQLCYGMGLRVSEIVNLKISDIDSGRMQVLVAGAKGKKDRYVNLPEAVLNDLRAYYREYRPQEYLFEGQYGGQYSIRSAQAVFKQAMNRAGIRKRVGIHSLRHSYATHLLEMGTDISFIQELLGHKDVKTTRIYAHVSRSSVRKIKSPLDGLI